MTRKLLAIGAGIVAVLLFMVTPAGAQYPDDVLSAEFSNTSPNPGDTVTVSGTCTLADEVVVALTGRGTLATIPVNADDTYSGSFTIPSDLAPGTYTVSVTCGTEVRSFTFTVAGATPPGGTTPGGSGPGGSDLARTGTGIDGLVKVAGALLVVGAAAALLTTKRRTASA